MKFCCRSLVLTSRLTISSTTNNFVCNFFINAMLHSSFAGSFKNNVYQALQIVIYREKTSEIHTSCWIFTHSPFTANRYNTIFTEDFWWTTKLIVVHKNLKNICIFNGKNGFIFKQCLLNRFFYCGCCNKNKFVFVWAYTFLIKSSLGLLHRFYGIFPF